MTDVLYLGTVAGPHPNQVTEANFQALHERLLKIPASDTEDGLEIRLRKSAALHTGTVVNRFPKSHQLITAAGHVVSSLGREQLEIYQGRRKKTYFGLGWLPIARASLVDVALQAGLSEQELTESVFFDEAARDTRLQLNRLVLAAVEPYGAYDRYAFAAGVAMGHIDSRPFRES